MSQANLITKNKGAAFLICALAIGMLLVWRIGYWTPMHSDDYHFLARGFSYDAIVAKYLTWSGRLTADFLGSVILSTRNHAFISFFNSLMFIALILLLTKLPTQNLKSPARVSGLVFVLVFCLYWIANPALGQTSLWLIGSANYLWTNVVQLAFLIFFLDQLREPTSSLPKKILVVAVAIAAGVSNENTSVTTALLIAVLTAREFYHGRRNLTLVLYVTAFVSGTLVLLLAPGNYARLVYAGEWVNFTLMQKIELHLFQRMPRIFALYWQAILAFCLLLICLPKKSEARVYAIYFALASVASAVVLVGAPNVADRSVNGSLIYLLISISFVSYELLRQPTWRRYVVPVLTVIACLYFLVSYFAIYQTYRNLNEQAQIRDGIIVGAMRDNVEHIEIPEFYHGRLLKYNDGIDRYFNGKEMAEYFGARAPITEYRVTAPYGSSVPPIRQ